MVAPLWGKINLSLIKSHMNISTEPKINWNDSKEKLQTKFSTLTDNDLWFEEGKRYVMLNRIQIKLGKTNEEMREILYAL